MMGVIIFLFSSTCCFFCSSSWKTILLSVGNTQKGISSNSTIPVVLSVLVNVKVLYSILPLVVGLLHSNKTPESLMTAASSNLRCKEYAKCTIKWRPFPPQKPLLLKFQFSWSRHWKFECWIRYPRTLESSASFCDW